MSAGMTPAAFTLVTDLFLLPLMLWLTPKIIFSGSTGLVATSPVLTTHASIPQKSGVCAYVFNILWNCSRLIAV